MDAVVEILIMLLATLLDRMGAAAHSTAIVDRAMAIARLSKDAKAVAMERLLALQPLKTRLLPLLRMTIARLPTTQVPRLLPMITVHLLLNRLRRQETTAVVEWTSIMPPVRLMELMAVAAHSMGIVDQTKIIAQPIGDAKVAVKRNLRALQQQTTQAGLPRNQPQNQPQSQPHRPEMTAVVEWILIMPPVRLMELMAVAAHSMGIVDQTKIIAQPSGDAKVAVKRNLRALQQQMTQAGLPQNQLPNQLRRLETMADAVPSSMTLPVRLMGLMVVAAAPMDIAGKC
ncbi:MAG: hypothetical protein M1812_003875 [Candelaria pacifica]|nr:MAG: hypothetical protein M1812_003875 [Candelaria pacifica]